MDDDLLESVKYFIFFVALAAIAFGGFHIMKSTLKTQYPVMVVVSESMVPTLSVGEVERLRRAWGFDKPLGEQYLIFLRKAVTGDFGQAIQYRTPAMELVMQRLLWTYLLAGTSALIALLIALPLGVVSAVKRNSFIDLLSTTLATVGTAMPGFWFGIMLILIFSVRLRFLPAFGSCAP